MKRARNKSKKTAKNPPKAEAPSLPFAEHIQELRRRLFYIAVSVGAWSAVAYAFEHQLIHLLLLPSKNQQFIYTSVGGGVDFLFRVCVYAGVAASIPVIVWQLLRYVEPLIGQDALKFIVKGSIVSGFFAVVGILYGYVWGLPAALHFLLHQFVTTQIRPLVTIQSYMAFVTVYMLGSAMLFQVPLIMIFINRIKPLRPGPLFKGERWVILGAFLTAGIMNPTPNLLAQLLLAGPIILMYQVGIIIVYLTNKKRVRPPHVAQLLEQDDAARRARLAVAQTAQAYRQVQPAPRQMAQPSPAPAPAVATPRPIPVTAANRPSPARPQVPVTRPRQYVSELTGVRPSQRILNQGSEAVG